MVYRNIFRSHCVSVAANVQLRSAYLAMFLADSLQCLFVANVRAFVARSRRGLVLGHNLSSLSDDVEAAVASGYQRLARLPLRVRQPSFYIRE